MKKNPQRTCIGCNISKNKEDLIRIVKNNQNIINIDSIGKAEGRGAYICNNRECLEKAIKNKRIEKAFKMSIEKEIYDRLREVISE